MWVPQKPLLIFILLTLGFNAWVGATDTPFGNIDLLEGLKQLSGNKFSPQAIAEATSQWQGMLSTMEKMAEPYTNLLSTHMGNTSNILLPFFPKPAPAQTTQQAAQQATVQRSAPLASLASLPNLGSLGLGSDLSPKVLLDNMDIFMKAIETAQDAVTRQYCKKPTFIRSKKMPARLDGPVLNITLQTGSCSMYHNKTAKCMGPTLSYVKKPLTFTSKHKSADTFTGLACNYGKKFGQLRQDVIFTVGKEEIFDSIEAFMRAARDPSRNELLSSIIPTALNPLPGGWKLNIGDIPKK